MPLKSEIRAITSIVRHKKMYKNMARRKGSFSLNNLYVMVIYHLYKSIVAKKTRPLGPHLSLYGAKDALCTV